MAEPLDYQTILRERAMVILSRHPESVAILRAANVTQIGDKRPYEIHHKPATGIKSDFPMFEVLPGDEEDSAFTPPPNDDGYTTLDPDAETADDATTFIEQLILFKIVHENMNNPQSARQAQTIKAGLRRGGRRWADPATPGSELVFMLGWGPVRTTRGAEWIKEGARHVTRIVVPCHLQFTANELDPT